MSYKEKSQKQLQVGEQIKREIANIFLREDILKDDNIKITVLEADISPDLKNVKIFIDIFGDLNAEKLTNELNKNNKYFRHRISNSLKLRIIPEIRFILDKTSKNVSKINKLLEEDSSQNSS